MAACERALAGLAIDGACAASLGAVQTSTEPSLTQAVSADEHPAVTLMAREARVRRGAVPRVLADVEISDGRWILTEDAFLLRAEAGIGLHYRRGEGITLEHPPEVDPREVALWLNGTLYAAVAALNGLFPLHASAVAHADRVFAFSGPPGAGKSTLVAGLGRRGFVQFCDDTLLLAVSGDGAPVCLPGHKRLKLWSAGAELAGVERGPLVAPSYPKHFVGPPAGAAGAPLPLAELLFLEQGEVALPAITGAERIERLQDDHYTAQLWSGANRHDRTERFATLASLARRIAMRRFVRSFEAGRFAEGLDAIAAHIEAEGQR